MSQKHRQCMPHGFVRPTPDGAVYLATYLRRRHGHRQEDRTKTGTVHRYGPDEVTRTAFHYPSSHLRRRMTVGQGGKHPHSAVRTEEGRPTQSYGHYPATHLRRRNGHRQEDRTQTVQAARLCEADAGWGRLSEQSSAKENDGRTRREAPSQCYLHGRGATNAVIRALSEQTCYERQMTVKLSHEHSNPFPR